MNTTKIWSIALTTLSVVVFTSNVEAQENRGGNGNWGGGNRGSGIQIQSGNRGNLGFQLGTQGNRGNGSSFQGGTRNNSGFQIGGQSGVRIQSDTRGNGYYSGSNNWSQNRNSTQPSVTIGRDGVRLNLNQNGNSGFRQNGYGYGPGSRNHNQYFTAKPNWNHYLPRYGSRYNGNQYGSYYSTGNQHYYYPQASVAYGTQTTQQAEPDPVQIQFGGFVYANELTYQLQTLSNEICLDLHHNYQNNPEFMTTYRKAYDILQFAKFAQTPEGQQDRQGLVNELRNIDTIFHQVEDEVQGWTSTQQQQIGDLDLNTKLAYTEETLHHLMYDAGVPLDNNDGNPTPHTR